MADKHPNSKKITIFLAGSFLDNAQTGAQEFLSMSKKSIGSYFATNLGKAIGTGLEFEEIDVLMPLIVDIPKDDRSFRAAVTDFFAGLVTHVPFGTGRELEIGLKLDNTKPVTYKDAEGKYNLPIDIAEYLRFRHAKRHPWVAPSLAAAKGNMLTQFYIFDQAEEDINTSKAGQLRDKAVAAYLVVKKDEEKLKGMLTLLGVDTRTFHGPEEEDLMSQALYKFANSNPEKFMEVYDTDNFELRFLVQKMINTGIIKRIGNQYVDKETSSILGHTVEEVIYYIKDTNHSDKVGILKANLQEAMKAKLVAPRRKQTNRAGV